MSLYTTTLTNHNFSGWHRINGLVDTCLTSNPLKYVRFYEHVLLYTCIPEQLDIPTVFYFALPGRLEVVISIRFE